MTRSGWARLGVAVLVGGAAVAVLRRVARTPDGPVLPAIGGDTWPPVPVRQGGAG